MATITYKYIEVYYPVMKQTLMVKLNPSKEQHDDLLNTLHRFNEACNFIAEEAFIKKSANKMTLQKIVYRPVRDKYGLSAQMAIRAIAKVCEAFKRDKTIKPEFRPDGAMVYDQRILSFRKLEAVSMLTLKGRQIIPVRIGEYQKARLDRLRGQADLILRDGIFYLAVIVEVPEPTKYDPVGALGVDLGIVNLAVDSDGEVHTGKQVDAVRGKNAELRSSLQMKGTRSAKRHLKRLSGKESRFKRNVNHCISKRLVAKAKDTSRAIALEDLKGIRTRGKLFRRSQRSRQSSWAFGQMRAFIEYKSALAGVPVVFVDPRGTSHTCPKCGFNDKVNRPSRENFLCGRCGFAGLSDHVSAMVIAERASVNTPIVARDFCANHVPPQLQASQFIGR